MSSIKQTIIVFFLLIGSMFGMTGLAAPVESPAPAESIPPQVAIVSAKGAQLAPPKKEKEETALGTILRKWAEADAKTREMHVQFTSTNTDRAFDQTTLTRGQASIKKPDLWRIDRLDKQGRMLDIVLLADKRLHLFNAETKTERIFVVPEDPKGKREKGTWFDLPSSVPSWREQALWLSFGPQALDMDSRYKLSLSKQDQWYIYLDIEPRNKKRSWFDWFPEQWFERGRIVLDRKTYQVRQVWYEYPNRAEVTVDFLDRRTNPKEAITRGSLLKGLPQGWKREELESDKEKK